MDYTQIESELLELELSTFKLSEVLLPVIQMGKEAIMEKKLAFVTDIQPDLPPLIQGDRLRLQQILLNLLDNGIKFTEQGKVCLRVTGRCITAPQWQLTFSITDTGIGMTPALQSQIFEPFTLGDASNTRKYSGLGMGLALVKQWVKLMGGTLGVSSQTGAGSELRVAIPVTAIAQRPEPAPSTRGGAEFPYHTLVVDDAPTNQKILQRFLERFGCTVRLANNGLEAIAQIEQHTFDFVFMDLQMPVMDGIEATKIIRQHPLLGIQPVIIAITANALGDAKNQCLAAGMDDFATKPITSEKVHELLEQWGRPNEPSDDRC
ncbi:MAG: response regulator [Oscillatoriales cyanobacterium SM2_2_1]|nr:response regulator [Oscillatoriales cyanobacterium SM2_2_1]